MGVGDPIELEFSESVTELLLEMPLTAAFQFRKHMGRLASAFDRKWTKEQDTPAHRRLAKKGVSIISLPVKADFRSTKRYVQGKSNVNGIQVSLISTSEVTAAHELGASISKSGAGGLPVRIPRKFTSQVSALRKASGSRGISKKLLLQLIKENEELIGFTNPASGKYTVYLVKRTKGGSKSTRRKTKGGGLSNNLTPVVTFHNSVKIKPTLDFYETWERSASLKNQYTVEMVDEIVARAVNRRARRKKTRRIS